MQKLNAMEFAELCHSGAPAVYIYDTENNPVPYVFSLHAVMRFSDVRCVLSPDRLIFSGSGSRLCINDVQMIALDKKRPCIGRVARIYTGSGPVYTILIDEVEPG